MFDAFCHFADNHPEASFFQSAAYIELIDRWPEAEWVLLLVVREEGMKDPGATMAGSQEAPLDVASRSNVLQEEGPEKLAKGIAGSLLAVVQHEPPPKTSLLKPFGGLYRLLTGRALVHGGPLMAPDTRLKQEMVLKLLLDGLHTRVKKRSMFTQFRNSFDFSDMKPLFREKGYKWEDHLNLIIDTSSTENIWKGMTNNRRRQVRLSIDNGAAIISKPSKSEVLGFYQILENLYRTKVKKPLPSKDYFLALHQLSEAENQEIKNATSPGLLPHARFFLVTYKNDIIGGSVYVMKTDRCIHEWYACGLDKDYKKHRIYPSVLSTWAAMEFAANNGIPVFDFMGMGRPEVPYGVRDFKKEFGGKWVNPGRFYKVNRRVLYSLAEIGYNVLFFLKR